MKPRLRNISQRFKSLETNQALAQPAYIDLPTRKPPADPMCLFYLNLFPENVHHAPRDNRQFPVAGQN